MHPSGQVSVSLSSNFTLKVKVAHCSVAEIQRAEKPQGNARSLLSKFRQMEEDAQRQDLPDGKEEQGKDDNS